METVFISYSHKDEAWKNRLVTHFKAQEIQGFYQSWDDRKIELGSDWFQQIDSALKRARVAVMLISADYLASKFINEVEIPRILERRRVEGLMLVPVIVKPCLWNKVSWLSSMQVMPKDGKSLADMKKSERDRSLAEVSQKVFDLISRGVSGTPLAEDVTRGAKVSLYKLPVTGDRLFGREKELQQLDEAWSDAHTRIVCLVAWGGVGKTALVNHWLNQMHERDYRGARRVYGWSFYSQGAIEEKQAAADEFFQETLAWFGDPQPGAGSAVEKGRRLARLASLHKTLLVLDGLETLQYPPGTGQGLAGKLKDPGLTAFLKEFAGQPGQSVMVASRGLCVITTRLAVSDLESRRGYSVKDIILEHLSVEAGVELLKSLGVTRGTKQCFQRAITEYNGHPLALTLLGNYIQRVHHGDIRKQDEILQLTDGKGREYHHAGRVMGAYEKWFGPSPERDILYLLGIFDRPVEPGAIAALRKEPAIPGVTDRLQKLSEKDWQWALSHLRETRLLAAGSPQKPGQLNCHPLVREYFGTRLKQDNPAGWKLAQERLFRYYMELPTKKFPDTLEEMEPLFVAVAHGCQAGLHREAFIDVYWIRISRTTVFYITKNLGAFEPDLACLYHFFEFPWGLPAAGLTEEDKTLALSLAAFDLRAMGRLQEAVQPMRLCIENFIQQENWRQAAINTSNLSELLLTLGWVSEAVALARQSVQYADRSGDAFQMEGNRSTLADVLHQSGKMAEAEQWFREAEAMQKKLQPEYRFLYSHRGYKFCDLLLRQGKAKDVLERADKALEISEKNGWLEDISLDKLSLGRSWLLLATEPTSDEPLPASERISRISKAMTFLDQAVEGLRKAGQKQYLAHGLINRAEGYRLSNDHARAWDDLNEALDIAELSRMILHMCDYHLEAASLCIAEGEKESAAEHIRAADIMIRGNGYHNRDKRLRSLKYIYSLSPNDLLPMINEFLIKHGESSIWQLPDLPVTEKTDMLLHYQTLHPEYDLLYDDKTKKLSFKNFTLIREFKELWNEVGANINNDVFFKNSAMITERLCSILGIPSINRKKDFRDEKILLLMANCETVLPDLKRNSTVPFIFLRGREIVKDDLEHIRNVLESSHTGRIIFIITFGESHMVEKSAESIREVLYNVYRYNYLIFDYPRLISIIGAKEPKEVLKNIMLSEIDPRIVSPFIENGPTSDEMFFGREKEIREIIEHADKASFALIGGRKYGKTSILRHLERKRLVEVNFKTFYFTCELMDRDKTSKDDFLAKIVKKWLPENREAHLTCFADFLDYLPKDKPLVFLIDEVDRLIDTDREKGWPLFGELRALSQEERCQFVFAGERFLREAVISDSSGRLYNFPTVQKIKCLNYDNVKELVCNPMKKMNIRLIDEDKITQTIWDFSKGHPNIVQRLCRQLIERLERKNNTITVKDLNEILNNTEFLHDGFLLVFWDSATILERIITLIMTREKEYYQIDDIQQILREKLDPKPKIREIANALTRLVDLRSILENTESGYKFFVDFFPMAISKTLSSSGLVKDLVEQYQQFGDSMPRS